MTTKGYLSSDWISTIELADDFLMTFIQNYRVQNNASIFILGHAVELYVKAAYWKLKGQPYKNSHNIIEILKFISPYNTGINKNILNELNGIKLHSSLDLIYNGHLADLKYLNTKHNNLPKLEMINYRIVYEDIHSIFKHLCIIFQLLEKNNMNSPSLDELIKRQDDIVFNKKGGYLANIEIVCLLKMALDPQYKPTQHYPPNNCDGIVFTY